MSQKQIQVQYINDFATYCYLPDKVTEGTESHEERAIFFAHASGIPAQTYEPFFFALNKKLNIPVFAYDCRGFGLTKQEPNDIPNYQKLNAWDILIADHIALFLEIKKQNPHIKTWIFMGHSLGAWLSILTAEKCEINNLFVLDIPILKPHESFFWAIASVLKVKEKISPIGNRVRKRRTNFSNYGHAFIELKQSFLMRHWHEKSIKNYVNSSFLEKNEHIFLRHSPSWEASMFDSYPANAIIEFLKIKKEVRHRIKPIFIVGEKSDSISTKSKRWLKVIFPKMQWLEIADAGHFFMLEKIEETVQKITIVTVDKN